ncbi:hypothetical protein AX14_011140 [Amanita brunnescens Koide BX004]|nr:hypothetical protein AX14_011140 [Amanita brunnescens Koide BX004]
MGAENDGDGGEPTESFEMRPLRGGQEDVPLDEGGLMPAQDPDQTNLNQAVVRYVERIAWVPIWFISVRGHRRVPIA